MFASRSEINGLTFCAASLFDALVYRLTNSVFSIALFAMCIVLHVFRVYTDESRVNHQPHEKLYNRVTPRSRWWWNNKPFLLPATRCRGSTSPHSPTILPPLPQTSEREFNSNYPPLIRSIAYRFCQSCGYARIAIINIFLETRNI